MYFLHVFVGAYILWEACGIDEYQWFNSAFIWRIEKYKNKKKKTFFFIRFCQSLNIMGKVMEFMKHNGSTLHRNKKKMQQKKNEKKYCQKYFCSKLFLKEITLNKNISNNKDVFFSCFFFNSSFFHKKNYVFFYCMGNSWEAVAEMSTSNPTRKAK